MNNTKKNFIYFILILIFTNSTTFFCAKFYAYLDWAYKMEKKVIKIRDLENENNKLKKKINKVAHEK